jgi:fermentation-respiration switch protein FrsA (DUF1100 family)
MVSHKTAKPSLSLFAGLMWILGVLLLMHLSAGGQDMFQSMDSAEKKFNEAQSRKLNTTS